MKIEGCTIADTIYRAVRAEVASLRQVPTLGIITCGPNSVTEQYLRIKKQQAEALGIAVDITTLDSDSTTAEVVRAMTEKTVDGTPVVMQLPLPVQVDVDTVISALPISCDVDGMRFVEIDDHPYISPVAGAVAEIISYYHVPLIGKKVVVIGAGRLVGKPVAQWCRRVGVDIETQDKDTFDPNIIHTADIVISGVGVPKRVQPDMVREGAILFDAGTSGSSGSVQGDIDPACYEKASLYTPVPGGIGPITIAVLLQNVIRANQKYIIKG